MANHLQKRRGQCGAVAIIVGLAMLVMVGMAGLVFDLGRLYVNRSELQTAADACALAAAAELVCDTNVAGSCTAAYLLNAENAGMLTAARNKRDFQSIGITISSSDVKFNTVLAPNATYLSRTGGASAASKFAMCTAHATGIVPWFIGALGAGASNVQAYAVATIGSAQSFCNAAPIGVCLKPASSAPNYGYNLGEWISSSFTSNANGDGMAGEFKWVDFTPNAGGNNEIRDQLAGSGSVCGIQIGSNVQQPGAQQGTKAAYNTRFGLYPNGANAYSPATAPPDRTGYAYPNQAPGSPVIAIGTSAMSDYISRQQNNTPFISAQYGVSGPGGNISGNASPASDHENYGAERRLLTVPIVDCSAGNIVPIVSMACVLMLNPMSNGANGTIYLEYRGSAALPGSPCRSSGAPGSGGSGPLIPTLVQ